MGGDPVPSAIEQAMDDQFVDNTLSEYIINWGFHNNAGKNGNTSKKPIITVDSSVNLPNAHIRVLKKLYAQRRSKMDSKEKELEEFARKNKEEAKRLAQERKELEA
ncbi:hypothetical protein C361_01753 [Cryptococcus neoformans Tu259-1]|nr:hypothetical protein C361_01753 [Cryptococcus neoformans var. grubii Tu259-1]